MKNFTKIALLLLLVIASIFVMASCDKDEGIDGEIAVKADAMPQLVYVLGNDLDLSNGVLQVTTEEGTQEVALNAEGVTVTGYDKNVLGEQTLTITYQGCTTQLTVTVVARMTAEDAVTEYLVGDSFDVSKGRVKITRDDATSYTMIFNSDKVTITGFDGTKAGEQNVTATYKNGDITYTCQFPVTVYAVDTVEFKEPTKTGYNSHDPEMNLAGGSLTLKGKNGTLVREVPLTAEGVTVSGFDVSAVTEENSPYTQTLTVTYKGTVKTFDVTLTYTDVSLFKKHSASYADLVWNTTTLPTISEELGELALELAELYMDFSPAEQAFITDEERLSVLRAAFTYGMDIIEVALESMEDAFAIEGGQLYLICEDYSALENAISTLGNSNHDLYRLSPILNAISTNYAEDMLWEPQQGVYYCFGDFGVAEAEDYENLLYIFRHMLDFADALNAIPENWQTQGVAAYENQIQNLYGVIFGNNYYNNGWADIYSYVSAWRENDDAFDLLYQYYYNQESNEDALNMLAGVAFPNPLDDIIYHISGLLDQITASEEGYVYDGTLIFYHYINAMRLVDQVMASEDAMIIDLYNTLPVNGVLGMDDTTLFDIDTMLQYVRTTSGGYYTYCGSMLGNEDFHTLINIYVDLVERIAVESDGAFVESEECDQAVRQMFDIFVSFTPTQQLNFLSCMNTYYGAGIPPLAFDDSGEYADYLGLFTTIVNQHYRSKFSTETGKNAYNDLVIAMEIYAQRVSYENWYTEFTTRLTNVANARQALVDLGDEGAAELAVFDSYLSAAYQKYVGYLAVYDASTQLTTSEAVKNALGDWADEFLALQDALLDVEIAYYYSTQEGYEAFPFPSLFLMAYERATAIYKNIETSAPENIRNMLYHYDIYGLLQVDGAESGTDTSEYVYNSFEYSLNLYRALYISYLQSGAMGYSIYDEYMDTDLGEFMSVAYDLCWPFLWEETIDKTTVQGVLAAFRGLKPAAQYLFLNLEGEYSFYSQAIMSFLTATTPSEDPNGEPTPNYSVDVIDTVNKLFELEQYYILYSYYAEMPGVEAADLAFIAVAMDAVLNGTEATDTAEATEGLLDMYEALSDADKATFADFGDMYDYYVELCQALIAASETPAA